MRIRAALQQLKGNCQPAVKLVDKVIEKSLRHDPSDGMLQPNLILVAILCGICLNSSQTTGSLTACSYVDDLE